MNAYYGAVPLGGILTIHWYLPSRPRKIPRLEVYSGSGKVAAGVPFYPESDNYYRLDLYIDDRFVPGHFSAVGHAQLSDQTPRCMVSTFRVVAGNPTGHILAICEYESPYARFLVNKRDSGSIYRGKNAKL